MTEATKTVVPDRPIVQRTRGDSFVVYPLGRRLRLELDGRIVADTEDAVLWLERRDRAELARSVAAHEYYFAATYYYLPETAFAPGVLELTDERREDPRIGGGDLIRVRGEKGVRERAAWRWDDHAAPAVPSGLIGIDSHRFDAVYEEDEPVIGARSPFHTIDTRASSRRIEVLVDGTLVAASSAAVLLDETGLPTRYYLPRIDVRTAYLRPSASHGQCPYKGLSRYWDVVVPGAERSDVAWSYDRPLPAAEALRDRIAFWEEAGVEIRVDGARRPPLDTRRFTGVWDPASGVLLGQTTGGDGHLSTARGNVA